MTPNAHGVYEAGERLVLPFARKGWRGVPLAEIRVAHTDEGWRAAASFAFMTGNHWGSSSPISRHSHPYASRDEAVNAAAARLRDRLIGATHAIEPCMASQRQQMLAWLGSLMPAQGDLFSGL